MEYANTRELPDEDKDKINEWLSETLTKAMGESDDVFVEYVMVMIVNGKTMEQISADLEAFIGEPACVEFALSLGEFLRSLSPEEESGVVEEEVVTHVSGERDDASTSGKESRIITLSSSKKDLQPLKSSRQSGSDKKDNKMAGSLKTTRAGDKKEDRMNGGLKSGRQSDKQSKIVQDALKNMKQQDGGANKRRQKGNSDNNQNGSKRQRNSTTNQNDQQSQPSQQTPFVGNNGNMDGMLAAYQQNMMQMMMQMMGGKGGGGMPMPMPQYPPNQFNQFTGGYRGGKGGKGGKGGRGGYVGHNAPMPPPPVPIAPALSDGPDKLEASASGEVEPSATSEESGSGYWGKGSSYRGGRGGKGGYHGWSGRGGKGGYKGKGAGRGSFEHKTWVRPPDTESELVSKRI